MHGLCVDAGADEACDSLNQTNAMDRNVTWKYEESRSITESLEGMLRSSASYLFQPAHSTPSAAEDKVFSIVIEKVLLTLCLGHRVLGIRCTGFERNLPMRELPLMHLLVNESRVTRV